MSLWLRLKPTRRRVVTYLVVLFALLIARLAVGLWAAHELQNAVERIGPYYGGLSLATLAPPAVPRVENRAKVLAAAAALVNTPGNTAGEGRLNGALTGGLSQDPTTQIPILRAAAEDNRLALEVLRVAETRAQSNWQIDYSSGRWLRLPSLMEIRTLANVIEAAARVSLNEARTDEALRYTRLGLVLGAGMASERQLLMQLVRVGVDQAQLAFIRSALAQGSPSEAALAALAPQFSTALDRSPAVLGLVGELKFVNSILAELEAGEDVMQMAPAGTALPARMLAGALVWTIRPAILAAHARALDQMHRTIQFARLAPFERRGRKLVLPADEPQPWWWRRFAKFTWSGFGRVIASSDEHLALARIASAAVALRRHQLQHGSYPASLEALVPAYLANVPVDPFNGKALEYRPLGAGFELRAQVPKGTPRPERYDWKIPR